MTPEASYHRRRIGGLLASGRLPWDYKPMTKPITDGAAAETETPPSILPAGVRGHGDGNDGMLTEEEAETLARLAKDKIVLEMGSWVGLSTIVLARVAKEVVSVDWHQGDQEMGHQRTLTEFIRNLQTHSPLKAAVSFMVGKFSKILPVLRDNAFDMAYIDGAHDTDSVVHDTKQAVRVVKQGGILAWHDANRQNVWEAILETTKGCGEVQRGPGRLAIMTLGIEIFC